MDQTRRQEVVNPKFTTLRFLLFPVLFVCVVAGLLWSASSCSVPSTQEPTVDSGPPLEPTSILSHDAWSPLPPDQDPMIEHRPEGADCNQIVGFKAEEFGGEDTLEVNTEYCNYATFSQPSTFPVRKGDTLQLRLWHFKLIPRRNFSVAHLSLRIGDWTAWDVTLDMPRESELLLHSIRAPRDFPKGTPLYFHLHNHGANTYHLIELSVRRP